MPVIICYGNIPALVELKEAAKRKVLSLDETIYIRLSNERTSLSCHFISFFCRHPVHPPSGRETGDSWHGCWPVGWEQTSPWERGVQHAGGVSGSRERVSKTRIIL